MTLTRPDVPTLTPEQREAAERAMAKADAVDWQSLDREAIGDMRTLQQRNRASWYLEHRPAHFCDASLADLDALSDPDGHVGEWLDGGNPSLMLVGPVGTGKSHSAYAIGSAACLAGLLVVAVSVPDLLADLRPGGNGNLGARARTADLLILDDLGAEKGSEWTGEQLSALLDARVRENRRQVVTTNLTYVQLVERLGERTMSRLTGGATVVRLQGDDRRRRTW